MKSFEIHYHTGKKYLSEVIDVSSVSTVSTTNCTVVTSEKVYTDVVSTDITALLTLMLHDVEV